jgi:hypothetical protein
MYEYNYYFREGSQFPIGIDSVDELVGLSIKVGSVERAGTWFTLGEAKYQGQTQFSNAIRSDPKLVRDLYIKTMSML